MSDPRLHERAREWLEPQWNEAHGELLLLQVQERLRHRALLRNILVAASVVILVGAGVWMGQAQSPANLASPAPASQPVPVANAPSQLPAQHLLGFQDGSTALLVGDRSTLSVGEQTPEKALSEVRTGKVQFDVVRNPERRFQVLAGQVKVTVLGTRFSVERQDVGAQVFVDEGQVLVEWPSGSQVLRAGEGGYFPRAAAPLKQKPRQSWQEHTRRGEYHRAFELLRQVPLSEIKDEVNELLLASDAARLSGNPTAAVPFLEKVLANHRGDARASLAAFTLGRLQLMDFSEPRNAAKSFELARTLAASGPLVEDALAREVEALWAAGDFAAARDKARLYLASHPTGLRRPFIEHLLQRPPE